MDKDIKTTQSEKSVVANKQNPNKSVTHFNWFARFEPQQPLSPEMLKSLTKDF